MLLASSLKRTIVFLLASFLAIASAGCSRKPADTLSMEEWIHSICLNSGIEGYSQKTPYYLNVGETSAYFDDIQAAVEYGVLSDAYAFDPEQELSRELAAYTLMNLAGKSDVQQSVKINDISESEYRTFIEAAVSSGLMQTDKRKCFYPERLIDQSEADELFGHRIETCFPEATHADSGAAALLQFWRSELFDSAALHRLGRQLLHPQSRWSSSAPCPGC